MNAFMINLSLSSGSKINPPFTNADGYDNILPNGSDGTYISPDTENDVLSDNNSFQQ